jgi:hypothetical protein
MAAVRKLHRSVIVVIYFVMAMLARISMLRPNSPLPANVHIRKATVLRLRWPGIRRPRTMELSLRPLRVRFVSPSVASALLYVSPGAYVSRLPMMMADGVIRLRTARSGGTFCRDLYRGSASALAILQHSRSHPGAMGVYRYCSSHA